MDTKKASKVEKSRGKERDSAIERKLSTFLIIEDF